MSLPSLELVNECVNVPKEVCSLEKVNPRQVARTIIKWWCNGTEPSPAPGPSPSPGPTPAQKPSNFKLLALVH